MKIVGTDSQTNANKSLVTLEVVERMAQLAKLPVPVAQQQSLVDAFNETLQVVDELSEVEVSNTPPTDHPTGLRNVSRADVVTNCSFSQTEALSNAKRTQDGFFVVNQVLPSHE